MGRPKALLDWHGRTFMETIVRVLQEAGLDRVMVVLGHDADLIREPAIAAGAEVVINADYRLGQFSSLRAGVAALPPDCDAAVVCLVDQPQLSSDLVGALLAAWGESDAPIVRPVSGGRGGHPLLFAGPALAEIRRLGPERTAFDIVQQFAHLRRDVNVSDDSILVNFDTPDDLARHREKN